MVTAGLAGLIFTQLKREFVPPEDRGWFLSFSIAPEGSTLAYTDAYQRRLEAIVAKTEGIESYFSVVGGFTGTPSQGILFALLEDWGKRKRSVEQIIGEVQPQFFGVPGVLAFASNPPAFGGFGKPVQFVVQNPDFALLVQGVDTLVKRARADSGAHQRGHRSPGQQAGADGELRSRPRRGPRRPGARCGRRPADAARRAEDQHLHP